MNIQIAYVDGSIHEASISAWKELPSEGVDKVTIFTPSGSRISQSHSLYWLYPEDTHWVIGEGSVRYDPNPLTEVLIAPDGSMTGRAIPYMPDLRLRDVKLGWWRPGEERPDG